MRGVYVANSEIASLSAAKYLMYVKAAATHTLELLEAHVTNRTNNTSAQLGFALTRVTALGTTTWVTTVTPAPVDVGDQASPVACMASCSANTPTFGAILDQQGVSNLVGYHYVPLPEDRPTVPPNGVVCLSLLDAPANTYFEISMIWREIG